MAQVLRFTRPHRLSGMGVLSARQQNLVMSANLKDEDVPIPHWYPPLGEQEDSMVPVLCGISLYGFMILAITRYWGLW